MDHPAHLDILPQLNYLAKAPGVERSAPPATIARCINYVASHYRISPLVVEAVVRMEGGRIGTVRKNNNGSFDLGVMQLNTVNLPAIQRQFPGVTWRDLVYKPCINIGVGTWFLQERIREAPTFWEGVGNYHSKTPVYRARYLRRLSGIYADLVRKHQARKLAMR